MHERFTPDASVFFCNKHVTNDYVIVSSYVTKAYKLNESKLCYPEFSKTWNSFYDYIDNNFIRVKVFEGDKMFDNPGPTITIYRVQCNDK